MVRLLRLVLHALLVRPLVRGYLRLRVRHPDRVPRKGPAVIVANHNSHLDALALMSLVPMSVVTRVRPVVAADYFCRGRGTSWFVTRIVGAIPINRQVIAELGRDPLQRCADALMRGEILIMFPEGSRGIPGKLGELKRGLVHLLRTMPYVPVTPIYLDGFARCMPKGTCVPRPYRCAAVVGNALHCRGDGDRLLAKLREYLSRAGSSLTVTHS